MNRYGILAYLTAFGVLAATPFVDVHWVVTGTALAVWALGSVAAFASPTGRIEPAVKGATRDDVR